MKHCLFTFRSVTPAQRAESLLRRSGITCDLRRTPRWMEEKGCGYSLRLHLQDAQRAAQALRSDQLPFRKVYLQNESGAVEEMSL